MYRRSDGVSKIPDVPNTLTCQSSGTNNAPWDLPRPQPRYIKSCPYTASSTIHIKSRNSYDITITVITPPLHQEPAHCCVIYSTTVPSSASAVMSWLSFLDWFDSPCMTWFNSPCLTWFNSPCLAWFDSTCLTWFDTPFPTWFDSSFATWFDSQFSTGFDSVSPNLIRLKFSALIFDLSHTIQVIFQSNFREYQIGQGVFDITQHWNCGIFHSYED